MHLISEAKQGWTWLVVLGREKRKLQTNNPHENRRELPLKNVSKLNSTLYKKGNPTWLFLGHVALKSKNQ